MKEDHSLSFHLKYNISHDNFFLVLFNRSMVCLTAQIQKLNISWCLFNGSGLYHFVSDFKTDFKKYYRFHSIIELNIEKKSKDHADHLFIRNCLKLSSWCGIFQLNPRNQNTFNIWRHNKRCQHCKSKFYEVIYASSTKTICSVVYLKSEDFQATACSICMWIINHSMLCWCVDW